MKQSARRQLSKRCNSIIDSVIKLQLKSIDKNTEKRISSEVKVKILLSFDPICNISHHHLFRELLFLRCLTSTRNGILRPILH